jgi:hypothetical protein
MDPKMIKALEASTKLSQLTSAIRKAEANKPTPVDRRPPQQQQN